jgi:hypothetical protein
MRFDLNETPATMKSASSREAPRALAREASVNFTICSEIPLVVAGDVVAKADIPQPHCHFEEVGSRTAY